MLLGAPINCYFQHTQISKVNVAIFTIMIFVDGDRFDVCLRTVSDVKYYPIEVENKEQENQNCNAGTNIACFKHQTARRYQTSKTGSCHMFKLLRKQNLYLLTILIVTLLGEEDEIGLGIVLGTISDANSYPIKMKNDLQEVQNDCAGIFFLTSFDLS